MNQYAEMLKNIKNLDKAELVELIDHYASATPEELEELFTMAREVRSKTYGKKVYFRGLIEFTSYCKNDCLYCGIRRGNQNAQRYRLNKEEILECCKKGYALGFRTFVLQGGEDPWYTDDRMVEIIKAIKNEYPDCALTLSIGEKSYESYKRYREAGADRYLLRHETASGEHYAKLHPAEMSLRNRKECLFNLKELGFQVGAGFMVQSPYQTTDNLAEDLLFLKELNPHMVGIGPFIPQHDSVFKDEPKPDAKLTLVLLAMIRLLLPKALLPATTALGTIDPLGREKGLNAGANVVMPNLSPLLHRKDYMLYDDKICTGEEAAECRMCLDRRIISAGFEPDYCRGDYCFDGAQSF